MTIIQQTTKKLAVAAHRHSLFFATCVGVCGDGATPKKLAVAAHRHSLFLAACVGVCGDGATVNQQTDQERTAIAIADIAVILTSVGLLFSIWMLTPQFVMPSILENTLLANEKIAWYLTRASGTVGYILLTASTVWGLLLSTKVVKELIPAPVSLAMHNYLAWTAIGLSFFHAFVLLFDSYYTYTIANLLIPFTGPYKPGWVGAGTIGFYLMLLTSVSFYCRKWIGQKTWRKLHYLTFGAYLLAMIHGWMAGTDSQLLGPLYVGSLILVGFLTIYRILTAMSDAKAKRV